MQASILHRWSWRTLRIAPSSADVIMLPDIQLKRETERKQPPHSLKGKNEGVARKKLTVEDQFQQLVQNAGLVFVHFAFRYVHLLGGFPF